MASLMPATEETRSSQLFSTLTVDTLIANTSNHINAQKKKKIIQSLNIMLDQVTFSRILIVVN